MQYNYDFKRIYFLSNLVFYILFMISIKWYWAEGSLSDLSTFENDTMHNNTPHKTQLTKNRILVLEKNKEINFLHYDVIFHCCSPYYSALYCID